MSPQPFTRSITGCARCHGGHPDLAFRTLGIPMGLPGDFPPLTHWATCPATGEPILAMDVERETAERLLAAIGDAA